ncbi:DUF2948 family protein [Pseudotabrizicola algicola]|uniref:DUF2948 family protein n=1 Tax=Pseudotabrizicola algicola TaxID=2709381 RepID=A0A6B3RIH9_9RHOB|nr:DUF2948 family protein [Pseudotabrizicola algicola]NEX45844.1 DUF2948 family protein [Pseudotabrizicola algicola]
MTDARYEDGDDAPLRLIAQEPQDVPVMAALLQDAVFPITEMRFDGKARRFAVLLNRFRWEDRTAAEAAKRPYERVRSLLVIEDILRLRSTGIDRSQTEIILSLLTMDFAPGPEGTGTLTLTLAGDGAVAMDVEAVSLRLEDVTRPYIAPSGKAPLHD